ncbi:MAG: hypothetical protein IJ703_10565 [Eubacterium sp.]|nr:hypothetical protein [Eubacterium sp.]
MDKTTHEVRLANWKAVIEQCQTRPIGQTAKQWLDAHDISTKQYYTTFMRINQVRMMIMRIWELIWQEKYLLI